MHQNMEIERIQYQLKQQLLRDQIRENAMIA